MTRYSIDEQTMDNVLRYLTNHPYKEVAPLINAIQANLKKLDETEQSVRPVPRQEDETFDKK